MASCENCKFYEINFFVAQLDVMFFQNACAIVTTAIIHHCRIEEEKLEEWTHGNYCLIVFHDTPDDAL